ncbi:aldehyde reductase [bacterium M00.F.Ca.ET.228.01.1.1]|uniref:SDR family oxidoreductase n=1 Tax=Paraburkholderia phenoliruptrix TaxID=252970 RepID=UPI0010923F38|nr:aldehyde reductase [Paraburkholderia phenoliruptrix]TGP48040.1 aldehyde reductase [bacterium M00.F.Ca.ET.228.01.1.1]TGS05832.1 aldehyde reductase [bacterium M00.F.Ca.ET.191.01.1.1]TGU10769.1 aldehyde reductase [bacterium M00.F.Ca.ET.155.01.1.1]MBW0445136.1 aldehyde reductase [Paraburkholderia phenoliruptrix]MBW9095901.1 aldehyde reductase [Paraburkholderia phenoliruptrix]
MSKILVTGGSGFVGSHVVAKLLNEGHQVRTTIRSTHREAEVRRMVRNGGVPSDQALSFSQADLTEDHGWAAAAAGCDYVLHVASPFPQHAPENEDELIVPARDGTLRILRAARDAGAKRVVLTSSFAAIGYGHTRYDKVFDEEDWTDPNGPDVQPYIKSKTIAERAAWDFIEREGGSLEMSVVNPVGIFGPVLGPDISASIAFVKQLLEGVPPSPGFSFGMVDVRDLADLHIRAMTAEVANGQRFIAVSGDVVTLFDIAATLREQLGELASKVQMPETEEIANAPVRRSTSDKAMRLLGWRPRGQEETIIDTARSLFRYGVLS